MKNFWEKKKGIFSSYLWFSTLEVYYADLNCHCEPAPHQISILFAQTMQKAIRHTFIIDFSHYVQ